MLPTPTLARRWPADGGCDARGLVRVSFDRERVDGRAGRDQRPCVAAGAGVAGPAGCGAAGARRVLRGQPLFELPLDWALVAASSGGGCCSARLGSPTAAPRSYRDVADCRRQRRAVRAAGTALGRTRSRSWCPATACFAPAAALGGYGGGLDAKRFLLDLEAGARSGGVGQRQPDRRGVTASAAPRCNSPPSLTARSRISL